MPRESRCQATDVKRHWLLGREVEWAGGQGGRWAVGRPGFKDLHKPSCPSFFRGAEMQRGGGFFLSVKELLRLLGEWFVGTVKTYRILFKELRTKEFGLGPLQGKSQRYTKH